MSRIIATLALLLALNACVTPSAQKPTTEPTTEAPAASVTSVAAAPKEPPAPEPAIDPEIQAVIDVAIAILAPAKGALPEETPEVAVTEPPQAEPPVIEAALEPEIDDDPQQLMGLAGIELTELLGEPGFRREDADAQIWQYGGGECALDIYLYRGGEALPHRVTYYEFRGGAAGRPCLRSLLLAETG